MSESPTMEQAIAGCAAEPIRIPGCIQDVGMLMLVNKRCDKIVQISDNCVRYTGLDAKKIIAEKYSLSDLLNIDQDASFALCEEGGPLVCDFSHLAPRNAQVKYLVFVHPGRIPPIGPAGMEPPDDDMVILELEEYEVGSETMVEGALFQINSFSTNLADSESVETFAKVVAAEVQRASGYDRVMIYQFDSDFNGMVVAEETNEGLERLYLGHYFPSSDIPLQARQLYHVNKIRVISDVDYKRSMLVPEFNPKTGQATDLTSSIFRAVSPIHLQYLKNMNVAASFSISLLENRKLWGLVACHHRCPRFLPYAIRSMCWTLGNTASLHLSNILDAQRHRDVTEAKEKLYQLEVSLNSIKTELEELRTFQFLLGLFRSEYAIVTISGEHRFIGHVADTEHEFVEKFLQWASVARPTTIIRTDSIIKTHPDLTSTGNSTAGMMYIPLSLSSLDYIVFFRVERIQMIPWAGNPLSKPLVYNQETRSVSLQPRASFELFEETVRGRSLVWSDIERDSASQTQHVISRFVEALRIEHLQTEVQRSMAARKQLEIEKQFAEDANRMKTRFMATVSHEVRTPLNAIMGMVDLTLTTQLTSQQRDYLSAVQKASDALSTIITDVLDISKMEEGKLPVVRERFNLSRLIRDTSSLFQLPIQKKGLTYEYHESSNIPRYVLGDPGRIRQVISNLLSNALKFTETGSVFLSSRVVVIDGVLASIMICVRDTGIGIPKEKLGMIFDAFEQVDSSFSRRYGGSGLGLNICKRLAHHLKGEIWAESELGVGSLFSFCFPVTLDVSSSSSNTKSSRSSDHSSSTLVERSKDSRSSSAATRRVSDSDRSSDNSQNSDTGSTVRKILRHFSSDSSGGSGGERSRRRSSELRAPPFMPQYGDNSATDSSVHSTPAPRRSRPRKEAHSTSNSARVAAPSDKPFGIDNLFSQISSSESALPPMVVTGWESEGKDEDQSTDDAGGTGTWDLTTSGDDISEAAPSRRASMVPETPATIHLSSESVASGPGTSPRQNNMKDRTIVPDDPVLVTSLSALNSPAPPRLSDSQTLLPPPLRILVCEDNLLNQKLIRAMLSRMNYIVTVAEDGNQGVAEFTVHHDEIDLILMDVYMPNLDGINATKQIRQLEVKLGKKVPVIALTAQTSSEDRKACLEVGMNAFMTKPVRQDQLRTLIEKVMQGYQESL